MIQQLKAAPAAKRHDRTYSLARALLAEGDPDGLEAEVSAELRAELPLPTRRAGVMVPVAFQAALDTQTPTAGAELVVQTPGPFHYALQPRPLLRRLGATVLSGIRGELRVPRLDAGPEVTWVEEADSEPVEETTAVFGESVGQLRTATATIGISRQLLRQAQSNPDAEAIVRRSLERAAAAAVDTAGLAGAGGSEPTGVLHTLAVPVIEMNGPLSHAKLLEIEREVADDGAEDEDGAGLSFVTSPTVREYAKGAAIYAEAIEDVGRFSPLWVEGHMVDKPAFATPLLAPLGDSDPVHALLYGRWQHLVVNVAALEVLADPVSLARQGVVEFTLFAYVSVAIGQPSAFRRVLDIEVG